MHDSVTTAPAAVQTLSLTLPGVPPNITKVDGWAQRREATPWREKIVPLLVVSGPAIRSAHVDARIVVIFADRRERNPELYEVLIRRALGEALIEVGWIDDRRLLSVVFEITGGPAEETAIELQVRP
jgi:hypothetical protein